MHVLLHDFGDYPFAGELARALAGRGHRVTYAFCASLSTTPGGGAAGGASTEDGEAAGEMSSETGSLTVVPLDLGEPLAKDRFVRRWRHERRYGALAAALTARVRPDVVLSANMPLDAQAAIQRAGRRLGVPFVFWLQDVIGVATDRLLRRRLPGAGALVGRHYLALEARLLRRSDAVVPITDDFRPLLARWGVADDRVMTIENWAPLAALPVRPKDTAWAREHGVAGRFAFVYTGTLGMKHNPEVLARLAEALGDRDDARVVVLSQGAGAEYLREAQRARGLTALHVTGYEPFARVPDVMGAADVLTAVLEPDAGAFSVPSKVLAYLCAARPLLAAMPAENLGARLVAREGAGLVVPPGDLDGFVAAALGLLEAPPAERAAMGARARAYAERTFDIARIADRFEAVLAQVVARRASA